MPRVERVLPARFFGRIAGPGTAHAPVRCDVDDRRFTVVEFDDGFIAHASGVTLHRRDDRICLALGEPRFDSPEFDAIARGRGIAAAWLEAFERQGDAAATHVKGRFAAIIIDIGARRASLIADRFGTWPICYAQDGGALCFADRADAVPGGMRRLSPQAIYDYLYFHMIPSPSTIFEGVRRLPAGQLLTWNQGRVDSAAYWRPVFDENKRPDLEQSKRRFLEIIEGAVAREASGHEVGAFLSGGTDSSTVSGMLCKVLGKPARGYSIGFDAAGYDEMEYARIAARHFGIDHREYYVTPDDLLDGIPQVAIHYDQPFGNSSAVPAWICASRARADGVDKMLAGDGGDELFGGNTRYAKQRVFGWYDCIPGPLRKALLEPALALPGVGRIPLARKGASYVEQARVPMPDRLQMYNMLERLGTGTLFEPEFLARVDPAHPLAMQRETWGCADAGALINRMLAWDWKYTLADNDLPKVIGTTELAGLAVGFPLLSDELLEFSTSLPPEWKLKGLTLRWFFKEALRGFLPDAIITKKKHGFGLPFGVWACSHEGLKALARDTLENLKPRGIIRPAFIDELLDTHLPAHPNYYGEMVWILMMLELWMQGHAPAD